MESSTQSKVEGLEKLANIAEIMELLDDMQLDGREWLVKQTRENGLDLELNTGANPISILKKCPSEFVAHLLALLRSQSHEVQPPTPLPKTYHWFFTDIVSSADPLITTAEQLRKIIALNRMIKHTEIFKRENPESMMIIPTGDGVAIGFEHNPEKPFILALQLHDAINRYNHVRNLEDEKIYIRIGLDTGPVFVLEDLRGKENVWGPGIITARRVMDLAKSMNILASDNIAKSIRDLKPEYRDYFYPIGPYQIKHGESITIYNIHGEGKGNPDFPESNPVGDNTFFFNRIEVYLQINNSDTMNTHHSWLWDFKNISKKVMKDLYLIMEGDEPRDFKDLNLKVTDEENNKLAVKALHENAPLRKEVQIELAKPLLPYKTAILKIEYEWEETKREYYYKIFSECKEFRFNLVVPKQLAITHKVLKVDEFKQAMFPKKSPEIKFLEDRTEVSWYAQNLHANEKYRFSW